MRRRFYRLLKRFMCIKYLCQDFSWDFMLKASSVDLIKIPRFKIWFSSLCNRNKLSSTVCFLHFFSRLFLVLPKFFFFLVSKDILFRQSRRLGYRRYRRKASFLNRSLILSSNIETDKFFLNFGMFGFFGFLSFLFFDKLPINGELLIPVDFIPFRQTVKFRIPEMTTFFMLEYYEDSSDFDWGFYLDIFLKISAKKKWYRAVFLTIFKIFHIDSFVVRRSLNYKALMDRLED